MICGITCRAKKDAVDNSDVWHNVPPENKAIINGAM